MIFGKTRWLGWLLFYIYLLIVVKLVFFKVRIGMIDYHYELVAPRLTLRHNFILANFTPFRGIINTISSGESTAFILQNLLGNIVLYMPLGFLLPALIPKLSNYKSVTLTGFLLSLTFELIQLFGILGNFDVDDILLNTIGALAGFFCLQFYLKLFKKDKIYGSQAIH